MPSRPPVAAASCPPCGAAVPRRGNDERRPERGWGGPAGGTSGRAPPPAQGTTQAVPLGPASKSPGDFRQIRSISSSWAGVTTLTLQVRVLPLLSRSWKTCYRGAFGSFCCWASPKPLPSSKAVGKEPKALGFGTEIPPGVCQGGCWSSSPCPSPGIRGLRVAPGNRSRFCWGKTPLPSTRQLRDVPCCSLPFQASAQRFGLHTLIGSLSHTIPH